MKVSPGQSRPKSETRRLTAVNKAAVSSPGRVSGQRGLHVILTHSQPSLQPRKTPAYCNLVAEVEGVVGEASV